jgi:serine/threonine protein phosphatase PrpC
MRITCPHCQKLCQVAEQYAGMLVRCSACQRTFTAHPDTEVLPEMAAATPPPKPTPLRLDVGCATSCGRVRRRNEDSFLVQHLAWSNLDTHHEVALLVVADGMGGHDAGDRASGLAINTIGTVLAPLLSDALGGQFHEPNAAVLPDTVEFALQEANRVVCQEARTAPHCRGMGATAAVALVWDRQVWIGHVGDCRVYHQHGGRLLQVTRDQTLVTRMLDMGKITPAEALTHPGRHEVTQAVGKHTVLEPARYGLKLAAGDWLIVACDGLQAHLDDAQLRDELNKPAASARHRAHSLVALANQRGGSDNCTVIAVHCY